jgi:hypothetical protein
MAYKLDKKISIRMQEHTISAIMQALAEVLTISCGTGFSSSSGQKKLY